MSGLTNSDAGDYVCYNSGVIEYDATACLASDQKIKENVETLKNGLSEVMALRPVQYDLKKQYNPHGKGKQVGFIAQEVDKVDPRLTNSWQKDRKLMKVNYEQSVAILVKAIQEQQKEIDELKKKIH
jgi:predicted RNase H-like nuclease (RuvC/YqgF family)